MFVNCVEFMKENVYESFKGTIAVHPNGNDFAFIRQKMASFPCLFSRYASFVKRIIITNNDNSKVGY